MPWSCKWSLSFRFSDYNFIIISLLSILCCIPLTQHSPWFDHPTNIWWEVQIVWLLHLWVFTVCISFLPLHPYIFLSTLFCNSINPCSVLNVKGHISHSCKKNNKILVWYKFFTQQIEFHLIHGLLRSVTLFSLGSSLSVICLRSAVASFYGAEAICFCYEACPESKDTKVLNMYNIFNLQKRHWMNCLYITLFFNIVASIVETFIKSWNQLLYPQIIEVCSQPFESRHDFLNLIVNISPSFGEFTAPLRHILPIHNVTINSNNLFVNFPWTFTFCVEKSYDGTHLAFGETLDRRCYFKHISVKQSRFYHCQTNTAHR